MNGAFETLAFALIIGGQFLAAIFLISKRREIYSEPTAESTSAKIQEVEHRAPKIA